MATCAVCRETIADTQKPCPRCAFDNSTVEKVNGTLGYFGNIWGILSFLLILPPLLLFLLDNWFQPIASVRVAAPISFLITFIVAFYMYSLKDALHHYSLTRRFRNPQGRSIAIYALIFFVAAILLFFFLSFALASKESLVGLPGVPAAELQGMLTYGSTAHMLFKLAMTGCLIFTFVFMSLSASMMAAYLYGHYAEERRPAPIFLDEVRLIKVVENTVRDQINGNITLNKNGMKRLEDGGISLNFTHEQELKMQGKDIIQKTQIWLVEADCWGRVLKIEEKSKQLIKAA